MFVDHVAMFFTRFYLKSFDKNLSNKNLIIGLGPCCLKFFGAKRNVHPRVSKICGIKVFIKEALGYVYGTFTLSYDSRVSIIKFWIVCCNSIVCTFI